MQQESGLTLIELMVTLLVMAVVAGVAFPSFQTLIQNNRLTSQINALSGAVAFARNSALSQPDGSVTLCVSNDQASCSGNATWESGWIVFRDIDGDAVVDAGDDDVIRVKSSLRGGNSLRASGFGGATTSITFDNEGYLRSGVDLISGTFVLCDSRGTSRARGVVVSGVGQVRPINDGNDHDGQAITCP